MLTKELRNKKLRVASVRLERAKNVAKAAESAIRRRDEAQREVDWLKAAPLKDGEPGEDLPSDDELAAYVAEKLNRKGDDQPADSGPEVSVDGDDKPLF